MDKINDGKFDELKTAIGYFLKQSQQRDIKDLCIFVCAFINSDLNPLIAIAENKELRELLKNNFSQEFIYSLLIFLSSACDLIARIDHNHIKDTNYSDIPTNKTLH